MTLVGRDIHLFEIKGQAALAPKTYCLLDFLGRFLGSFPGEGFSWGPAIQNSLNSLQLECISKTSYLWIVVYSIITPPVECVAHFLRDHFALISQEIFGLDTLEAPIQNSPFDSLELSAFFSFMLVNDLRVVCIITEKEERIYDALQLLRSGVNLVSPKGQQPLSLLQLLHLVTARRSKFSDFVSL